MKRAVALAFILAMSPVAFAADTPSGPLPPPPPPPPLGSMPTSIGIPHVCTQDYPATAVSEHAEGTTVVGFTIIETGTTANVHVVRSSGNQLLDDAAVTCASRWLYRPAIKDNHPHAVPWEAEVRWLLSGPGTAFTPSAKATGTPMSLAFQRYCVATESRVDAAKAAVLRDYAIVGEPVSSAPAGATAWQWTIVDQAWKTSNPGQRLALSITEGASRPANLSGTTTTVCTLISVSPRGGEIEAIKAWAGPAPGRVTTKEGTTIQIYTFQEKEGVHHALQDGTQFSDAAKNGGIWEVMVSTNGQTETASLVHVFVPRPLPPPGSLRSPTSPQG